VHNLCDQFNVKNVVQKYMGTQLNWGKTDCVTFFFEVQTALHGLDTKECWYGKYHDLRSAMRWANINMPAGDFSKHPVMQKYTSLEVEPCNLQLGDAVLSTRKGLPHAAVYYNRLWWSVWDGVGFGYTIVHNEKYKVWRLKECHK